jgi:hypothetical protein
MIVPLLAGFAIAAGVAWYALKSPAKKAAEYATGLIESGKQELKAYPSIQNGLTFMPENERNDLYKSLTTRLVNKVRDDDGETEVLMLENPGTPGVLSALVAVYGANTLSAPGEKGPFSFLVQKDPATGKTLLMASRQGFESKYAGVFSGKGWEVFLMPGQAAAVGQATGTSIPQISSPLGV